MSDFGKLILAVFKPRSQKPLSIEVDGRTMSDLCEALLSRHGEVSGLTLARNGCKQSNGTMLNYVYDPSQISHNREQFVGVQTVFASAAVKTLSRSVTSKTMEIDNDKPFV